MNVLNHSVWPGAGLPAEIRKQRGAEGTLGVPAAATVVMEAPVASLGDGHRRLRGSSLPRHGRKRCPSGRGVGDHRDVGSHPSLRTPRVGTAGQRKGRGAGAGGPPAVSTVGSQEAVAASMDDNRAVGCEGRLGLRLLKGATGTCAFAPQKPEMSFSLKTWRISGPFLE